MEKIYKLEDCNENQRKFIIDELKDGTLMGIPGGGKTTTIIKKILYLIDKKVIKSKNDFMIITFSKKAKEDFIKRGNSFMKNIFTTKNVKTLHSLSGTIIKKIENTESLTSSIEIVICKAYNYINELTPEDLKKIKCLSELKLLIIDEAQDISELQYNLAKKISEKLKLNLILSGDPDQNIYQFQNGTDKYLFNHSNNIYYLTENYRSSPEIIELLNSVKPWKHLIPKMNSIKPKTNIKPIIYSNSLENIMENFSDKIKSISNKYNLKDVAIIGPVKKSNLNKYNNYTNIGLQHFVNHLEKNKIKYIKHYSESSSNYSGDTEVYDTTKDYKDNHINLLTIHGSKGLEFKVVFLINFHTNTYGKIPSETEYNNFKYLWYVGLSRAENEIIMYVDNEKSAWYELNKCEKNIYNLYGKDLKLIPPKFDNKEKKPSSITELLRNKKYFDEEKLLDLSNYIKFNVKEIENIYENNNNIIEIENKYNELYGIYYEQLFEYYYCKKYNKEYKLSKNIKKYIENRIEIDKDYNIILKSFLIKINKTMFDELNIYYLNDIKKVLNQKEIEFYNYLMKLVLERKLENFYLYTNNELIYDNPEEILELCNNLNEKNLFKLILYKYQYNNEAKYLWNINNELYSNNIILISKIENYVNNNINNNNYEFQKEISCKYLEDLNGIIDCYNNDNKEIIEIKYTKNTSIIHFLQIFIYNLLKNNNKNNFDKMTIINLYEGKKYILEYDNNIKILDILIKLSDILKTKIQNLTILYDLETTGLIENNKYPDIIDRHFYEINLNEIIDTGLINPKYKISEEIEKLTNITNTMLEETKETYEDFKNKFIELNNRFKYPIYIAHNGNSFDHKIMVEKQLLEINKVKFKDSRQIIINFTKITGKLSEMYEKIFNKKPEIAHRANADVELTYKILKELKLIDIINN